MTLWKLVLKEIAQRKLNFFFGILSVILAVIALVGSTTSLTIHDFQTQQIIRQKEEETQERMRILEDDYRKIMKKLGFNLLIIPQGQNLADLYMENFTSKYMPQEYADRLAASKIISIRHLLPSLQQRIFWQEGECKVILIGIRGEVPFLHRDTREPILVPVPEGSIVVGYELHKAHRLAIGDKVKILGKNFTVTQCNEERGNKDDITFWIDLEQAQTLLNKPGQINAILALKCQCAGNEIARVRSEVSKILPGTQVIEEASKVVTRAEARDRAAQAAAEAILAEKAHRRQIRNEQQRFTSIFVPSVMGVSVLWIVLLFVANVRERRSEIGILRAVGLTARKILGLFILKAFMMGIAGSLFGIVLGIIFSLIWQEAAINPTYIDWQLIIIALFVAPAISILASWIPALMAVQQDPAVVLSEES